MSATSPTSPLVGVLALQGAFEEHQAVLHSLGCATRQVRRRSHLEGLDGIVLPGGESTAMALVDEMWGLFPELRRRIDGGLPVLATCAGLILLADGVQGQKQGGQSLIGGLDVVVCRNFFGSQVDSFEMDICARLEEEEEEEEKEEEKEKEEGGNSARKHKRSKLEFLHRAVFIRAPAVVQVGPGVETLASVSVRRTKQGVVEQREHAASKSRKARKEEGAHDNDNNDKDNEEEGEEVVVAVRHGNTLALAFHPELSDDKSWHVLFLRSVQRAMRRPS